MTRPRALILGTGISGLSAALQFARRGVQVTLLCKAERTEGATRWAQGGIASVWSKEDSFEEHKRDTIAAGVGLCREETVDLCVREGPARVRELIEWGVEFTRSAAFAGSATTGADSGAGAGSAIPSTDPAEAFDLHREGGHGKRRILHAADLTGWAIEKALLDEVARDPRITVLEHHVAIDLITEGKHFKSLRKPGRCLGAYALDAKSGSIQAFGADITVLATGGAGKVYLYTSNPDTATGDGIAMAYRAGAQVANLEFMQFHPTCLYHPSARTFLITEALRGEGAVLRNVRGEEFMARHHEMGSLAPRDIVARAIDTEMKRTGDKHVYLDLSPLRLHGEDVRVKFPHIHGECLKYGIDIGRDMIPVVPAAHYTCGGVVADTDAQTNVQGLYAIGEVACTGLHGANRLASNSLLEAVVFAYRAVEHAMKNWPTGNQAPTPPPLPEWDSGRATALEEKIDIAANWLEIRSLMWNYVGIVRSNHRLERAGRRLNLLRAEIDAYYWNHLLTKDLVELRNLLTVADLIVQCAIQRHESRGLHYTVDFPGTDSVARDTVIGRSSHK